ncbi:COG5377 Phage-related protein, predicted endonuclease [uncultured Caudovirales phage]|uniref:COG5377 Phage-related protein, predicted endonuclease n=1 Tax=uncultured Caudovirales phage TaxID=2100421 RepID=A0A6J5N5D6_9CAUD|nr:COG5377 Phage-related protein, predicted endonuclease [uncultured Caudovirales phage]
MALRQGKERETLPVNKLSAEINELLEAVLLGDFANGSQEWHDLRDEPGAVGGSDIAPIAGLSQWESAITKWAKKTKQIPDEITPNMSMRLGTKLEAPILDIFTEEHPELTVYETGTWANKENPWARSNPDGLYQTESGEWGIVEVKFSRDYWTAPPQAYRAQVLWYMKVFGIKQARLVALAGSSYQEYDIEWDEFEAQILWDAAIRFREACLEMKMPYWDGSNSTLETIRALSPGISDTEVDLDDLGMHYLNSVTELEKATTKMTELKARVIQAMDGAKRGLIFGEHLLSLRSRAGGAPYLHHEKGK